MDNLYGAAGAVIIAVLIFTLIAIVVGIILYIILSLALYKMAVKAGLENPWLAWIPVGDFYILGKLIKSLKVFGYLIPSIEIVLPIASVVVVLFNRVTVIGPLLSLLFYALELFTLNKLYKMYKPESAVLFTILSVFGLPVPFILMSIKDLDPVEIAD